MHAQRTVLGCFGDNPRKSLTKGHLGGRRVCCPDARHLLVSCERRVFVTHLKSSSGDDKGSPSHARPLSEQDLTPGNIQAVDALSDETTGIMTVAVSDEFGQGCVLTYDVKKGGDAPVLPVHQFKSLVPCEEGWSSVLLDPKNKGQFVSTHFYGKYLALHDQEKIVSSFQFSSNPTHAHYMRCFGADQNVVCVTDNCFVNICDLRMNSIANRIQFSNGVLLCGTSSSKYLAVAGEERTVFLIDPRKFHALASWQNALKYEIGYVGLSEKVPEMCVCGSASDSEVNNAMWDQDAKQSWLANVHRIRGDARWVGLAQPPHADDLFGVSVAGSLYHIAEAFNPHLGKKGSDGEESDSKRFCAED